MTTETLLGVIGWDAQGALWELIQATGDHEAGAFAIPVSERACQALVSLTGDGIRRGIGLFWHRTALCVSLRPPTALVG
jgi:hypothetical protein